VQEHYRTYYPLKTLSKEVSHFYFLFGKSNPFFLHNSFISPAKEFQYFPSLWGAKERHCHDPTISILKIMIELRLAANFTASFNYCLILQTVAKTSLLKQMN